MIATGLRPRRIPALPLLDGVHVLRSRDDTLSLRADLDGRRHTLVVGAGFIGCEVAAGVRALGISRRHPASHRTLEQCR
ncbi:FAD-dependent oxidoreductase [Rhodococcus gannanensis]|uniref:FAD-dependent oxidoreductase n=1 Tax=Rhodococcus gannanensis TaxID=1960308 RepID=A0ABW4PBH4_9NOCA